MPSTFRRSPRARNSSSALAQVQPPPFFRSASEPSEGIVRIEEDCDRTFIDQLHGHHGLKNSRGDANTQLAERLAKFIIERSCKFRRRRGDEARPTRWRTARIPVSARTAASASARGRFASATAKP